MLIYKDAYLMSSNDKSLIVFSNGDKKENKSMAIKHHYNFKDMCTYYYAGD